MSILYVTEQGAKLSIEQRRILIQQNQQPITKVPLAHIRSIIIFGNIGLTTPAMKRLMSTGIDVVFLSQNGQYQGRLVGEFSKFGLLRQQQYDLVRHEAACLPGAQHIVAGKIHNMRTLLRRYAQRYPAIDVQISLDDLAALSPRCFRTQRLNSLLGVEGRASAIYFQAWRRFFKTDWAFNSRQRRPPTDPVNVLLSFGYTLLTAALESTIFQVGLDPYLGVLHRPSYGRPSLALDLVEEFRAPIVDTVVLRVLNNEIITLKDFRYPDPSENSPYPILLSDAGRKRFVKAYEERLATEVTHPISREKMDYRRVFERQTRYMLRHFQDRSPYRPFAWR